MSEHDAAQPHPPIWFKKLLDDHGVQVFPFARMLGGTEKVFWACNGDCSCMFVIDDDWFIDRYSFVNEDGWCQGQDCPCHSLPRHDPTREAP